MNLTDKTRRALVRLGMSSPEIRAYSVLLRSTEPTAAEVSQSSGVPYSKIYDVLGSLEEKGWVGSTDSRPTRYLVRSPATSMDIIRRNQEKEFERDRASILSELTPIYEKGDAAEKPDILVLSGPAIEAKMLEMANTCHAEVLIAIPDAGRNLISRAMPRLRALHDRGVSIKILVPSGIDEMVLRHLSRVSSTVRVNDELFGGGLIADSRYVMILLSPEKVGAAESNTVAIWADHSGLAGFAAKYFEYLFEGSGAT